MNYRPVTPLQKVLRCVTLLMQKTCEKRKARIEMIKENIIKKENDRITNYQSQEKTKEIYKKLHDINKKFLKL